jgi:hypothetical protein
MELIGGFLFRLCLLIAVISLAGSLFPLVRGEFQNFFLMVLASAAVALLGVGLRWVFRGKKTIIIN